MSQSISAGSKVSAGNTAPTVAIVGGCGHVGLPLGIALANNGCRVTLIDISAERVALVASGKMPFFEDQADVLLPAVLADERLRATTSLDAVKDCRTVIVTIGTPVDEFMDPSIYAFDRALDDIMGRMAAGSLLIVRSTVFPGVTERLARRVADRGLKIEVAYCPERIIQGYGIEELRVLPQIIGGTTPTAAEQAAAIFQMLGAKTLELSPIEAELGKLFANAFRYISFSIANQFYEIAERFGADFHRIHATVTKDYPRMTGFARAGLAAGPCLLKDTMQLGAFNHNDFVLGQAAMMVNEGLPSVLVQKAKQTHDLRNMTAAVLGMAFKGDSDDARDSLSYKLRKLLTIECKRVVCTDPLIEDPAFVSLETALAEADIVFLGACHSRYRDLKIDKPVIDVFNFLSQSRREVTYSKPAKG